MCTGPATVERTLGIVEKRRQGFVRGKVTVCRRMDGVPWLSAEQDTSGTMPFGIFVCTRAVVSYMGILFS